MKIYLQTLGCKLNQAETEELKQNLLDKDFFVVENMEEADIAVIRACAVTCKASQTTRELIRRFKKLELSVIAIGCLENNELPEIDFVARNNEEVITAIMTLCHPEPHSSCHPECNEGSLIKSDDTTKGSFVALRMTRGMFRMKRGVFRMTKEAKTHQDDITNPASGIDSQTGSFLASSLSKTRQMIKIQTGCNFQCAYCIIPSFRGKSDSVEAKEIIHKIKEAQQSKCKEVVLTGINICQYQDKKTNLAGLLKKILAETQIERIRLGSLDPRLITPELIKIYSDKNNQERLLPHWHISLQSGSDEVLKSMYRGYTAKQYADIVEQLRQSYPLFSLTTDIIVGYPTETETDFQQSCDFVEQIQFSKVHVFPFSPRPGTAAAKLKPLHNQVVTDRAGKLRQIAQKTSNKYIKQFIGKTRPVLFEQTKKSASADQIWLGYTPEYFRISHSNSNNLTNKIKNIKLLANSLLL